LGNAEQAVIAGGGDGDGIGQPNAHGIKKIDQGTIKGDTCRCHNRERQQIGFGGGYNIPGNTGNRVAGNMLIKSIPSRRRDGGIGHPCSGFHAGAGRLVECMPDKKGTAEFDNTKN